MIIRLNSNEDVVHKINKALQKKVEKYGMPYCPCVLPNLHDDEHICPCKEFLETNKIGECHCGKYIKTEV